MRSLLNERSKRDRDKIEADTIIDREYETMTLWLVRSGRHGEFEQRFLDEGKTYLTWGKLNCDLSTFAEKPKLRETLVELYPDAPKGKISNNLGQIWAYSHTIKKGDWIVLPSKTDTRCCS